MQHSLLIQAVIRVLTTAHIALIGKDFQHDGVFDPAIDHVCGLAVFAICVTNMVGLRLGYGKN
ncbi:hypothetical protein [Hydrogenovibrio halophilus]|uniref:hypothetical protein n=1 Tax=Hydrogenovibrio halophilus TaxID=373391 RepID=UPI00037B5B05|nr:hypothetical protein [Hydrogenovibrio halophilus]